MRAAVVIDERGWDTMARPVKARRTTSPPLNCQRRVFSDDHAVFVAVLRMFRGVRCQCPMAHASLQSLGGLWCILLVQGTGQTLRPVTRFMSCNVGMALLSELRLSSRHGRCERPGDPLIDDATISDALWSAMFEDDLYAMASSTGSMSLCFAPTRGPNGRTSGTGCYSNLDAARFRFALLSRTASYRPSLTSALVSPPPPP
ncbi:hypothetical protein BC629DRAFT_1594936 [Irpex lacteus]|nr:hypothetical protein BC629DRAFT_1594936 [Irpex lacteus]